MCQNLGIHDYSLDDGGEFLNKKKEFDLICCEYLEIKPQYWFTKQI